MKVNFIGGDDVQRSLNHSDNRCVNLVPSLNDKGDIAAFYKVDGLKSEGVLEGVPTGAYKASNGRAFYTSGTVLYELTVVAGVYTSTSRGTITTATTYRMSDNGIEMILVNGTDGWLFTFSTNALQKIKVATADFTVTIADPAVFTKTAHGLVAGDAIRLTTTTDSVISDNLLDPLTPSTLSAGTWPTSIAVAPANNYAYVASVISNGIYQFSRDTATGALSPLSPPYFAHGTTGFGTYGTNIAISSDGISAYRAGAGVIHALTITLATGLVSNQTPATVAFAGTPQCVIISPDDAFVYVTNISTNTVAQYSRNLATGELIALTPATITVGSSPKDIIIGTNTAGTVSFAYVANSIDNTISVHVRNVATGLLTQTPAQTISSGGLSPNGLAISPETGNVHLYVTNTGSANVAMFSRDETTGLLTALSTATAATGVYPTRIAIASDGDSVYVVNQSDATVSMFGRDNSTGILTAATVPTIATGGGPNGIAIAPDGNSVYVCNRNDATVSMYSRSGTAEIVGLPTGLSELTTYYVISAGLTSDAFEVSETSGGTAVSTSGQQAGVHTYTTLGYGFPEGAKTVSYMNGRFVALEPNTQNFFVSEVLDGKWWDALNVQTVDSNPDYVIGEIVSHNELIVFCDDSGEVFYDSGTVPTPFVRNSSGIFEVGCIAPYSICNLDNQVFWLGGDKTGKGIVYKLQGYTPLRISTHSIEYAIQSMSTTSDARAFSYQKDGHHYYVLTFPTGNKTFVYDVNTGLWHERAKTTPDAVVPSMTWTPSTSSITGFNVTGIAWNGTVYCAVGTAAGSATTICYTSADGITWTQRTIISGEWQGIAWNGTVFCAVQGLTTANTISAVSADGITWAQGTMPASVRWRNICSDGTIFVALGHLYTGGTGYVYVCSSTDGLTWTIRSTYSQGGASNPLGNVSFAGSLFFVVSNLIASKLKYSSDGITWSDSGAVTISIGKVEHNGSIYVLLNTNSTTAYFTSSDGITWTSRAHPVTATWLDIASVGGLFCTIISASNNTYMSSDGINWTLNTISGAVGSFNMIEDNGSTFVTIGTASPAITAISTAPDIPETTYVLTEWPANNHLYFNDEHLVTDSTTTLLSIDSATYKNGSEVMQYIRSFNVPTQNMNRTRHTRLQLDCEAGVASSAANITLKWSDDGAHTFNTGLTASLGTTGEYSKRVVWHRLGMTKGQPRVYELSGASDSKVVLINVHLD